MILFRTNDERFQHRWGRPTMFHRKPDDQYFTDFDACKVYYVNETGFPIDDDGKPIAGEIVTKFVYTAEEYMKAFPEAEKYRNWLSRGRRGEFAIVQALPWGYGCMIGHMNIVNYFPTFIHPVKANYFCKPNVCVNDGDDSYQRKTFETDAEALQCFKDVLTLAPFAMQELHALGFNAE